jgi:hypothetical protein
MSSCKESLVVPENKRKNVLHSGITQEDSLTALQGTLANNITALSGDVTNVLAQQPPSSLRTKFNKRLSEILDTGPNKSLIKMFLSTCRIMNQR